MPGAHGMRAKFLRDKFRKSGIDALDPREAVELLIGYLTPAEEVPKTVDLLFTRFGTVSGIINAAYDDLAALGINDTAARCLSEVASVYSSVKSSEIENLRLDCFAKSAEFFGKILSGLRFEQIKLACLGPDFSVLRCDTISEGSTGGVYFSSGNVVEIARSLTSTAVIISHNHPYSPCTPSGEDVGSTNELKSLLATNGITLVDHVVIGTDGAASVFGITGDYGKIG